MSKKLYVGNLPYNVDDSQLQEAFTKYGSIKSARVVNDRDTGRSKGFGFVEFENPSDAQKAQGELNGADWGGRSLKVDIATERPREERGQKFGGGRGGR